MVDYLVINVTLVNASHATLLSINNWLIVLNKTTIVQKWTLNFNRSWNEYREGFGDLPSGEYWFGLEGLHQLTSTGSYRLRVEVQTTTTMTAANGSWLSSEYYSLAIRSESEGYAMRVDGFNGGDGGDTFNAVVGYYYGVQNGRKFSTYDVDQDTYPLGNCALLYGGGFWYCGCAAASLTGSFQFTWNCGGWVSNSYHLKVARMMIKLI